jgi:hypothetical protein
MKYTKEDIKLLREKIGCGMEQARIALEKCNSIDSAYYYLKIKSLAVARYKIVNGKRILWGDEDFIAEANKVRSPIDELE